MKRTAGSDAAPTPAAAEGAMTGDDISRELVIQPDGTITLPLIGQVRATRHERKLRRELHVHEHLQVILDLRKPRGHDR